MTFSQVRMEHYVKCTQSVRRAAGPRAGLGAASPAAHSRGTSHSNAPRAGAGSPTPTPPPACSPRLASRAVCQPGQQHLGAVHGLEVHLAQSSRSACGGGRTSSWIVSEVSAASLDHTLHTHTACGCEPPAAHPRGAQVVGTGGVGGGGAEAKRMWGTGRAIPFPGPANDAPHCRRRRGREVASRREGVAASRAGLLRLSKQVAPLKDILLEMNQTQWLVSPS